jgi:hypothetical protein
MTKTVAYRCWKCRGAGKLYEEADDQRSGGPYECPTCHGSGTVTLRQLRKHRLAILRGAAAAIVCELVGCLIAYGFLSLVGFSKTGVLWMDVAGVIIIGSLIGLVMAGLTLNLMFP